MLASEQSHNLCYAYYHAYLLQKSPHSGGPAGLISIGDKLVRVIQRENIPEMHQAKMPYRIASVQAHDRLVHPSYARSISMTEPTNKFRPFKVLPRTSQLGMSVFLPISAHRTLTRRVFKCVQLWPLCLGLGLFW